MGCSYDVITARVRKQDQLKFMTMFNDLLKEDLYDDWAFASADCFSSEVVDGRVLFAIDQEPLFTRMENGWQFFDFCCHYLNEVQDNGFTAHYECTFNNCGAMVVTDYSFQDGILTTKTKQAEEGYISCCEECGYEDEEGEDLANLADWEEGQEIVCPNCDAVLEFADVSVEVEETNVAEYCAETDEE